MKTIYITLLTALFFTGNAQFTMLSQWHAPDSSSSHTTRSYDSVTAIPKAMGPNMTWDFNNMKRTSNVGQPEVFGPASTGSNYTMYPTATIVGKTGTNTAYYSTSAAQWEYLGDDSDKFTDPLVLVKWPVNYNSTWSDTYSQTSTSGSGTLTGACTGYGTVILPGGAKYDNCMQLHIRNQANVGGTLTAITDGYSYFSQLQRFPLISINYTWLIAGTDTIISDGNIDVNELVAVGINDYNFDASYAIYPNPTSDNFTLKLSNNEGSDCNVQIINITGQIVKEVKLGNETTIEQSVSIGELSSGVYMVKTSLGDKTSTRRLVVK